jgi:hypothetical protein
MRGSAALEQAGDDAVATITALPDRDEARRAAGLD